MSSNITPSPLTDRQLKLLHELLLNPDIKAACAAAGVGRTTAYRWLKQPDFSKELSRLRSQTYLEAREIMHALTARAAMVLAELLESDQESIRRTAAQTILRHSEKVNELTRG